MNFCSQEPFKVHLWRLADMTVHYLQKRQSNSELPFWSVSCMVFKFFVCRLHAFCSIKSHKMSQEVIFERYLNASELLKHCMWVKFGQCEYRAVCSHIYRAHCFVLPCLSSLLWVLSLGSTVSGVFNYCSDLNPGFQEGASFCVCWWIWSLLDRWPHALSADEYLYRKRLGKVENWRAQPLSRSWIHLEMSGLFSLLLEADV